MAMSPSVPLQVLWGFQQVEDIKLSALLAPWFTISWRGHIKTQLPVSPRVSVVRPENLHFYQVLTDS